MQDTLNIEVERHPMWDAPHHGRSTMNVLRQQIARSLTPFDGRPNNEFVIGYCQNVYRATELDLPVIAVVGSCITLRVQVIDKIEGLLKGLTHLREQQRVDLRQQIKVIHRLSDEFATALAKSGVNR